MSIHTFIDPDIVQCVDNKYMTINNCCTMYSNMSWQSTYFIHTLPLYYIVGHNLLTVTWCTCLVTLWKLGLGSSRVLLIMRQARRHEPCAITAQYITGASEIGEKYKFNIWHYWWFILSPESWHTCMCTTVHSVCPDIHVCVPQFIVYVLTYMYVYHSS